MSENYKPFSETLTSLLAERKVSRVKLAKYLGLTNQAVSAYTLGKIFPDYENLLKIADFFDVSLDYLLTGKRPENKNIRKELGLSEKAVELLKNAAYANKDKDNDFDKVFFYVDKMLGDEEFYSALEENAITIHNAVRTMNALQNKEQEDTEEENIRDDLRKSLSKNVASICVLSLNDFFMRFYARLFSFFTK